MSSPSPLPWCDNTLNLTSWPDECNFAFNKVWPRRGRLEKAIQLADLFGSNRCQKPWLNGLPRLICVSDKLDSLTKRKDYNDCCGEIVRNVVSEQGRRHRWLWLTTRPELMRSLSLGLLFTAIELPAWPTNLWVGAKITASTMADCIPALLKIGDDETIRFLVVESQGEPINLQKWLRRVDWVIQGGECGPTARPFHVEWAQTLLADCRKHQVPYFLSQLGSNVFCNGKQIRLEDGCGSDRAEWPQELRTREFPKLAIPCSDEESASAFC